MNQLTHLNFDAISIKNNKPVTTSLEVAKYFDKSHRHVLGDIQRLDQPKSGLISPKISAFFKQNFTLSSYTDDKNRTYPMYEVTKNGFVLLVMGYTGEKAMLFKIAYIKAFDHMQYQLGEAERHFERTAMQKLFKQFPHWSFIKDEYSKAHGCGVKQEEKYGWGKGKVSRAIKSMVRWGMMSQAKVDQYQTLHRQFNAALQKVKKQQAQQQHLAWAAQDEIEGDLVAAELNRQAAVKGGAK